MLAFFLPLFHKGQICTEGHVAKNKKKKKIHIQAPLRGKLRFNNIMCMIWELTKSDIHEQVTGKALSRQSRHIVLNAKDRESQRPEKQSGSLTAAENKHLRHNKPPVCSSDGFVWWKVISVGIKKKQRIMTWQWSHVIQFQATTTPPELRWASCSSSSLSN